VIAVTRVRNALFVCGIAGVLLSLSLVIGSFLRHVDTANYLKQADEGVPWVRWGFGSAVVGLLLCCFGKRWWRIAGLISAVFLVVWWCLIAESLY